MDLDQRHRSVNNTAQGWGAAALAVLATIACFAIAYWIHSETYRHPRDLMFEAVGSATAAEH